MVRKPDHLRPTRVDEMEWIGMDEKEGTGAIGSRAGVAERKQEEMNG